MKIKAFFAILLVVTQLAQAMEKPSDGPFILRGKSLLTPEQETEIAKVPEQERNYKLRDFIIHNVLQESATLDVVIARIKELAQAPTYKNVLAFDLDFIKKEDPIQWLVHQQHAELDDIMKLYVYALTHSDEIKNKNFVIELHKALPGLDKLEKNIENLSGELFAQKIQQLAADPDIASFINNYHFLENIVHRLIGRSYGFWQIFIASSLRSPAAGAFLRNNEKWENLAFTSTEYNKLGSQRVLFLVQSLPSIASPKAQAQASVAMIFAIGAHNSEIVKELLQKNYNPNVRLDIPLFDYVPFDTALMYAVAAQDVGIIALLLEAGANPNQKSYPPGSSRGNIPSTDLPLILAIQIDRADIVELLLNMLPQQIQALRTQEYGRSYLSLLPADIAKLAAAKVKPWKADPNLSDLYGNRALNVAVQLDELKLVQILLAVGADINGKDRQGHTPLMAAAQVGNFKLLKFLIQNGADPKIQDNKGRNAFSYVSELNSPNKQAIIDYLSELEKGKSP